MPLHVFCKRHGHVPTLGTLFDRAFARFLQKARLRTSTSRTFRPCLCTFFAKGTVVHLRFTHISTVPLHVFCKRHGHVPTLGTHFDRAFSLFLQKARSLTPASRTFRPCLCTFFAKGTVAHLRFTHFSTVPLHVFCKRHGRTPPLHAHFDRAFALFYQKARSHTSASRTFRPCLCTFFAKGTVVHPLLATFRACAKAVAPRMTKSGEAAQYCVTSPLGSYPGVV